MSQGTETSKRLPFKWLIALYLLAYIFLSVVVVVLLVKTPLIIKHANPYIIPVADAGSFGDQFGLMNALFSGLAFAGVILTLLLQMNELRYQRLELQETQAIMGLQSFEQAFFQLLRTQETIRSELSLSDRPSQNGRAVFDYLVRMLGEGRTHKNGQSLARKGELVDISQVMSIYNGEFWSRYSGVLGHYFRNLYNAMRFIDQRFSVPDDVDQSNEYQSAIVYVRL